MGLLISILYAPIVFFSLKLFDITTVSILLFFLSVLWFFYTLKTDKKNIAFPLFYILTAVVCFFAQEFFILKALPLFISIFILFIFTVSFLKKESIILSFVSKFTNKVFSEAEKEYMQRSTLFWIIICSINVLLHLFALFSTNINFWLFYGSIGGYLFIIIGGMLQYLHKKYIFKPQQSSSKL